MNPKEASSSAKAPSRAKREARKPLDGARSTAGGNGRVGKASAARSVRASPNEKKSDRAAINSLRKAIEEQREELDAQREQLAESALRQEAVQGALYDLQLGLAQLRHELREETGAPRQDYTNKFWYQECVRRIRDTVRAVVPRDAVVLVATRGDQSLLDLYGRRAWHFPGGPDGANAPHSLSDGTGAIAHLEVLRARGATYLVFPKPALWWLEKYPKFDQYLHQHYPVVERVEETCVVFELTKASTSNANTWLTSLAQLIADHESGLSQDPAILDWKTGLGLRELLPTQNVFSPPHQGGGLPYLDRSIEIVAIPPDKSMAREARRVASHAVVTLDPASHEAGEEERDRSAREVTMSVKHIRKPTAKEKGRTATSTSIIIPTHDAPEHLRLCLESLDETLPEPFVGEVIVVDDASGEETQALLTMWRDSRLRLKVVRNRRNLGFVLSCNRGASAAKGDVLVFLNDDTLPQTGWLPPLLQILHDHPDAGAVGGRLLYPDGSLQEAGSIIFSDGSGANFGRGDYAVDAPIYGHVREVDYCSGALLATPRRLFIDAGSFNERYRPAYYEDADYCFALRDRGYRVYYQPDSVVVHSEGATGGTDLTGGVKKYQAINQAKFAASWSELLKEQPERPRNFNLGVWQTLAVRTATHFQPGEDH